MLPTNHKVLTRPRPRARPRWWRGTRCRRRAGPRRPPGGCSPWPRAGGWGPGPRWCWAGRSLGPCPEQCHRYQPCYCVVRGDVTASLIPRSPPQCQQPASARHASTTPEYQQFLNKAKPVPTLLTKIVPAAAWSPLTGAALMLSIRFNDTGGMKLFQKIIIMIIFRFGQNKLEN